MCSLRGTARVPSICSSLCVVTAFCALMPLAAYAQQPSPPVTTPPAAQPSAPQMEPSARERKTAEKAYSQGVRAMEKGDVDAAEKAFARAAKADPSNRDYAADLQIGATLRILLNVGDLRPLLAGSQGERIARNLFADYPGDIPAGAFPAGWVPTP